MVWEKYEVVDESLRVVVDIRVPAFERWDGVSSFHGRAQWRRKKKYVYVV